MGKKNEPKSFFLKDLEEVAKEVFKDSYPQYIGNGLYKIAPNCIMREKGLALYYEELRKQIKSQSNEV